MRPLALMIVLGSMAIVLTTAVLVAVRTVAPAPASAPRMPALEGTIVDAQQPQLPDVRTHTRRTPELPQAA